ncbi:neuronal acetylcholine receptor subunit alpha-10-like [Ylistrum balloti]|uniref:neuronal acetylcholine receptor subunit alpha-10-like n=1 Tax=Ylistrum balloti TaxID=509963 RepID=UPI002905C8DC|nr:neuronal acetylcholine receptor subunit alpha-10-like [Ylistrum balloti]
MLRIIYIPILLMVSVNCRSDIPEEDIMEDLFYSYNRHARPSTGPDHTVKVSHSLTLTNIVTMDQRVLTADTWQMMKWQDSRLNWNPDDYAQVDHINIPDDLVWIPDIILYNNAAATSGKTYASIRVIVDKDGNAQWIPGTRVTAYCEKVKGSDRSNVMAGDFKCPLKFGSWTYHEADLNMTIDGDGLLMADYSENPDYQIVDQEVKRENLYYACCPKEPFISITYTIWLRRKCHQTVTSTKVCGNGSNAQSDTVPEDGAPSEAETDESNKDTSAGSNDGNDTEGNGNTDDSINDGDDNADTEDNDDHDDTGDDDEEDTDDDTQNGDDNDSDIISQMAHGTAVEHKVQPVVQS